MADDVPADLLGAVGKMAMEQLGPLVGTSKGKITAFRLVAVVAVGDSTFSSVTVSGVSGEVSPLAGALHNMMTEAHATFLEEFERRLAAQKERQG